MLTSILEKTNTYFDSLLVAILCCVPMISFLVNINNIIPFTLGVLLLSLLIKKRNEIFKNYKKGLFFLIYIFIFFIFLLINCIVFGIHEEGLKKILSFFVYGFLPWIFLYIMYICNSNLKFIIVIKFINFFYALFALSIYTTNFWVYTPKDRMAISYYILPLLLSVFFEFLLDKYNSISIKVVKAIIYLIIYYPYLRFTIGFMSRGTILSVFLCVFFAILCLLNKKNKIILSTISILVAIIILIFGVPLLEGLQSLVSYFNISFEFINKNLNLLQSNNLGNGRSLIYQNAINGIIQHPIIGNGIGSFNMVYGTYPHNFIMQTWYEGGILYMLFLTIPIIYSFFRVVYGNDIKKEFKLFYLFIFFLTIVRLLLSFEYWLDLFFWICIFISLYLIKKDIKKTELKGD